MTIWRMRDLDVVFISYDEECADENYSWLAQHTPRPPLRVHGVKGFHNAYLCASNAAATPRFVTVDADNRVLESRFFDLLIDDRSLDDIVFSFNSRNSVNGLTYGNGGIKCWPKALLPQVLTHECSDGGSGGLNSIDFNYVCRYYRVGFLASETICNATPYHAFRAGYREAVKLSLPNKDRSDVWLENLEKLGPPILNWIKIWLSVGFDTPNGIWTILGARTGLVDYWRGGFSLEKLSDYAYFSSLWKAYAHLSDDDAFSMADELSEGLSAMKLNCPILDPDTSAWFKGVFLQPSYSGRFDHSKPSPLKK
jgi:hypothetical protein